MSLTMTQQAFLPAQMFRSSTLVAKVFFFLWLQMIKTGTNLGRAVFWFLSGWKLRSCRNKYTMELAGKCSSPKNKTSSKKTPDTVQKDLLLHKPHWLVLCDPTQLLIQVALYKKITYLIAPPKLLWHLKTNCTNITIIKWTEKNCMCTFMCKGCM